MGARKCGGANRARGGDSNERHGKCRAYETAVWAISSCIGVIHR